MSMTIFRTNKGFARVVRVQVAEVAPKYVILINAAGQRRKDRRETLYHRYHLTFADAKRYLAASWRVELRRAKQRYDDLHEAMLKIDNLTETDL